jgi:hypothetical protein
VTSLWGDRLAEVWASPGKAGAGVVVGKVGVLTARHLAAGALDGDEVLARVVQPGFLTAPWTAMRVEWEDAAWDLALLLVDRGRDPGDRAGSGAWQAPASPSPVVVRLGTTAERDCEAVGFPSAEVQKAASGRPADALRQSEQAVGTLLPAGQGKPPQDPDRPLSQRWMPFDVDVTHPRTGVGWQGISGAGVILPDGRLVGVVVAAESAHEVRRLYAVPLAEALGASPQFTAVLRSLLGQPMPVEARAAPLLRDILRDSCLGPDGLPLLVREAGLEAFGVRDAEVLGEPRFLDYVPRDDDQDLVDGLQRARSTRCMLLVTGGSGTGKSRSAARAARLRVGDHRLLCPQPASFGRLHELPLDTLRPAVVWLDDAESYDERGFRDVVERLLHSDIVVIGTIRRSELEKRMAKGDLRDPLGAVLSDRKVVIEQPWKLDWSNEERARLRDHVTSEALLAWVAAGGSPSVWCVAGPELMNRLGQAKHDDERPCRYRLAGTVLDWYRTGIGEPISIDNATGLVSVPGPPPDEQEFGDALTWALEPVVGVGRRNSQSLLSKVASDAVVAHDYVKDAYPRTADSKVPDAVWRSALAATAGDDDRHLAVGRAAALQANPQVAEAAWRLLAERGNALAIFNLGNLLRDEGEIDAAKVAYQTAIDSGHPDASPTAAFNLGNLLRDEGYRRRQGRLPDGHRLRPPRRGANGRVQPRGPARRPRGYRRRQGRLPDGHRLRPPRSSADGRGQPRDPARRPGRDQRGKGPLRRDTADTTQSMGAGPPSQSGHG